MTSIEYLELSNVSVNIAVSVDPEDDTCKVCRNV
jgi:hypothetical protein